MRILIPLTFIALASTGFSQAPHTPDFSGTWQSKADTNVHWILAENQDQIHVQEFSGSSVKADYTCNEDGKECRIKNAGRSEKTSFWFNGPKLVELRVHGDNVIKRRFGIVDDGKTLEVELLQISPPGKTDKIAFSRVQ